MLVVPASAKQSTKAATLKAAIRERLFLVLPCMIHTFRVPSDWYSASRVSTATSRPLLSSWTKEPNPARQNRCRYRERNASVAARLRDISFGLKVVWPNRSLRHQPNIASRACQESRDLSRQCFAESGWLLCRDRKSTRLNS